MLFLPCPLFYLQCLLFGLVYLSIIIENYAKTMNWKLIESGFNTGKFNMDLDLWLAINCKADEAFLRLYRWQPYAISLGANQSFSDINELKCNEDNIDIVKRPTGGRAILHAEEWTYSVIIPLTFGLTPKEIYTKISIALSKGLALYDDKLKEVELESLQPNFSNLLKQPQGKLCFASTAKSEVKYKGKKLIGSAQRKLGKVVLQHGSILCGNYHKKLSKYLIDSEHFDYQKEFEEKTTELETILKTKIDYEKLSECIIKGFEIEWKINFV